MDTKLIAEDREGPWYGLTWKDRAWIMVPPLVIAAVVAVVFFLSASPSVALGVVLILVCLDVLYEFIREYCRRKIF